MGGNRLTRQGAVRSAMLSIGQAPQHSRCADLPHPQQDDEFGEG